MKRYRLYSLWPLYLIGSKSSGVIMRLLLTFFVTVVLTSTIHAQAIVDEDEIPSTFLFAGYSDKWKANEAFIIKTQEEMERIIQEMAASDYVPYFHELLPEPNQRVDFLPVVDFKQEAVIAIVGKKHDSPCRKTRVTGVKKDRLNDLNIDVEETISKSCKIQKSAAQANPVILFKVKRPVSGLKNIKESVKEAVEE